MPPWDLPATPALAIVGGGGRGRGVNAAGVKVSVSWSRFAVKAAAVVVQGEKYTVTGRQLE